VFTLIYLCFLGFINIFMNLIRRFIAILMIYIMVVLMSKS